MKDVNCILLQCLLASATVRFDSLALMMCTSSELRSIFFHTAQRNLVYQLCSIDDDSHSGTIFSN